MLFKKKAVEMWCFECDGVWTTKDYHNCSACIHCGNTSRIYRTTSAAFESAWKEKHPPAGDQGTMPSPPPNSP